MLPFCVDWATTNRLMTVRLNFGGHLNFRELRDHLLLENNSTLRCPLFLQLSEVLLAALLDFVNRLLERANQYVSTG